VAKHLPDGGAVDERALVGLGRDRREAPEHDQHDDAVKSFDIIFAITQGGPGTASETINIYLYSVAFAMRGRVMWRNTCQTVAPSMSALS
jgi:hypothetical protein